MLDFAAMKAVYFERYGGSDVLQYGDFPEPRAGPRQVLIDVHAASVNPRDWLIRSGRYFAQPLLPRLPFVLGSDVAGVVAAVGAKVRRFAPGDEVFAMQPTSDGFGGYAERIAVRESAVARKPESMSFVEAAAVPLAALTALQALRDDAKLRAGQRVVVVGASGGVGTYAVQIAKALGAEEVAGVASARNEELVRSLGADRFVDYRSERFQDVLRGYDAVFDTIGKESLGSTFPVLKRRGAYVTTVPNLKNALASLGSWLRTGIGRRSTIVLVRSNSKDLELLGRWAEEGVLRSVVDRVAPLAEAAAVHDYSRTFRTRGKNVLTVRAAPIPRS